VFARFDQLFGLTKSEGSHKNNVLLFQSWIEEVTRHTALLRFISTIQSLFRLILSLGFSEQFATDRRLMPVEKNCLGLLRAWLV